MREKRLNRKYRAIFSLLHSKRQCLCNAVSNVCDSFHYYILKHDSVILIYETKKEYTIGDIVHWIIKEKEIIKVYIYRTLYNSLVEYFNSEKQAQELVYKNVN